ncbi:ATP-binding protein [Egibacter rhizosphaerae]|uniref:ATP-binding protein n=1 Tax=Egibacter rhizosphaerae TaxID=1670831 RepID=A0A411YDL4_9ACTN|nr:ATP-binding protein [Egibacter rhizosphaerae]QBI19324.1 ATP-binding protein [Egibacter rhizosphaerae]
MNEVELRLPPDVAYVGIARLVVTAAARRHGLDDARAEDLKIAVSEATTNAILAHQRVEEEQPIVLAFGPEAGQFQVLIRDTGPGFEPPPPDDPDTRDWTQEGGLGVTVIRGLADEVMFVRERGTCVDMKFSVELDNHDGASDGNGSPDGDGSPAGSAFPRGDSSG